MKKKYIKPVTVVIATDSWQLLAGSDDGARYGAAKENVFFNDGEEDDGTDNTGWVRVGNVWDD